ncbi:DUF2321 domain-containing protein [Dellaglioa algida]|nr:DUF2321 domain-containing protein [Dellaglioa algida]MDK1718154.1 DUF2321 domain-containing protein [Dellaglioa algida]MDK1727666.1 DUF2321 domain-containing protein [Dellaglioa algida]MDK1729077.1 DUF2321 domain-containing protein [Dellaglioa algida]MDK1733480.1 DUF2321 domain-containing protein [Dellaglioa algida]MDK1735003.1 DUF2321 domain-containing protein [Dellaglioa algida]
MDTQYSQSVCLKGHQISSFITTSSENPKEFCEDCGSEVITHCPSCNKSINGYLQLDGVFGGYDVPVPSYCRNCSSPYPWTSTALESLKELINLQDELNDEEKDDFSSSLPDLISNGPKSKVAITKFNKYSSKISSGFRNFAVEIISSIASDVIVKSLTP